MSSEICRVTQCPFFGKFCGKAVCRYGHPKQFIKHMGECPKQNKNKNKNKNMYDHLFEQIRINRERSKREDCTHGTIDSTNAPFGEYTYRCKNKSSDYYGKHCRGCKYYKQKQNGE